MNSGSATLLELLALDEKAQFNIPSWRRSYVWTTKGRGRWEVERLWQDIRTKCSENQKHFCGVMLLHKIPGEGIPIWEIVDGQQRLATLFLLLIALRDSCEKRGVDCTDLNGLLRGSKSNECRLILHDGESSDRQVLNKIFQRTPFTLDLHVRQESMLYQAYQYLAAQVEREIPSGSQEFLVNTLQGIEVKVQITEPTEDTKLRFETLDARVKTRAIVVSPANPQSAKASRGKSQIAKSVEPAPAILSPVGGLRTRSSRLIGVIIIGLVLVLLCIIAAIGWWNYSRLKIDYFQGISSRYGVPQGVIRLTDDKPTAPAYRVESTRGQLRRISKADASGQPMDDASMRHAAIEEVHYRDDGKLDSITYLDHKKHEVLRETFKALPLNAAGEKRSEVDFTFPDRGTPFTLAPQFTPVGETAYDLDALKVGLEIATVTVDYNADGHVTNIQYQNNKGVSRPNNDAVFGRHFEYNPTGLLVKISNLGSGGKPILDKHNIASVTRAYDASGNLIEESYFDLADQLITNKSGIAKMVFKYDARGNKSEVGYFGVDGKPAFDRKGIAKWTGQYDEHDNLVRQSFFGTDGQPVNDHAGYATETLKYDDHGNVIQASYFGTDGKPVLNHGCAALSLGYDALGNVVEVTFLGLDGQPTLNTSGYAKETFKYDDHGNVTEALSLGVDAKPVLRNSGYARAVFKYNDRGNKIEEDYYDVANQPVPNKDGFAKVIFTYDSQGNVSGQSYFGIEGKPVLNQDNVARLAARYDERGNVIETTCYGIDGQLTLDKSGLARQTFRYDARDNIIETACFGVDGLPILDRGGTARAVAQYDDLGNKTEVAFFGIDGQPILNKDGFARQTFKHDARGNLTESVFFGIDGKPTPGKNGFTKETLTYDEQDRIIEGACFGVEGQPIEIGGAHRIVYTYDSANKVVKTSRYSLSGQALP